MSRLLTEREAQKYRSFVNTYRPSSQTLDKFSRSKFAVIAGPTGAGKDTLREALTDLSGDYISILSTTTRPPRKGESDGVQYHFKNLDFIERGFSDQRFLQAEVVHNQQISCLDIAEIEKLNSRQIGLSILVVQTEVKLRLLNPSLKTIFVVPPSLPVLAQRMQSNRQLSSDELSRRMTAAKSELQIALAQPGYFCVINDDIARASRICDEFLRENTHDEEENKKARLVAKTILNELS